MTCPYCEQPAVLASSTEVYGGRDYGAIWLCRPCGAWVGVHRNSLGYAPLGRLANAELRRLKMQAHAAFDPIWKNDPNPGQARARAYQWLGERMGLKKDRMHIGKLDEAQCRRVVDLCNTARGVTLKAHPHHTDEKEDEP